MLNIKIDNGSTHEVIVNNDGLWMNGKLISNDCIRLSDRKFHILVNDQSVTLEIVRTDESGKLIDMVANGKKYKVELKDQFDLLLKELNMDKMLSAKSNDIKAPMPGLVLNIKVKEGDEVKKGDPLLVLEAMKMENVIKSHADGLIRKILVQERVAVEKNQVLISLA